GLGLFWLIVKAEYSKIKLAIAFFSALAVQSILAVGQFLAQETFANKWLGLAAHRAQDLGASVVETVGADGIAERWLRAYGSLDHPNILGGLLIVGLIILIYCFISGELLSLRAQRSLPTGQAGNLADNEKNGIASSLPAVAPRNDKKFFLLFTFYFLPFTLFAALLFTFSRSAWLALAAAIVLFIGAAIIQKNWPALKRTLGMLALAVVLFSLIFISYQNLFITRTDATARLEVKSISERKMYLDDSLSLLKKNWLFGVGIGNYTKAIADSQPLRPWYYLQPVHNTFLLVWAETGIGGLIFFIAWLGYLFLRAVKNKNSLALSILLAQVIIMSLDHYFWSLPFGIMFFWLSAGFVWKFSSSKALLTN
ncbi:MAG TPA: O-antigen ligase family protein, partial [Candidatus Methylomirabilis sp.]|nr:O-antigen ligase family protein [Candidatus Methylomirabilis sp.]